MSDEQTRLMQQLLEVHKEHLALSKHQAGKLLAAQNKLADCQKKATVISQATLGMLACTMGLIVIISFLAPSRPSVQATSAVIPPATAATAAAPAAAGAKPPANAPPLPPGARYVTHSEE